MTRTVARSTPYSWPYDARLEPSRLALVVVLPDAGGLAAGDGNPTEPVPARIALLAGAIGGCGGVVLAVTATPPRGRRTSESGRGPQPGHHLGLGADVQPIASGGIDGFFASTLDATLRAWGRDQLLLCGQWLETNVHSTMRSANDRGYECLLVLDACVPADPDLVPAARSQIEMSGGIFGAVGETAAVLDALLPLPVLTPERDSR